MKSFCTSLFLTSVAAQAIIGGRAVNDSHSTPQNSVVALQLNFKDEHGQWAFRKGSGVLVGSRTILTAGHNVAYMDTAHDIEVIFSPRPCWGVNICHEQRLRGAKKILHPRFENPYPDPPVFDIALLVLEEEAPAPYKAAILPADFPPNTTGNFEAYGFGLSREMATPLLSDFRLRTVGLSLLHSSYILGSESLLWVDQSKAGICAGDSGGPLFREHSDLVLGIVSHVGKDTEGRWRCLTQAAFSDVTYFMPWISRVLETSR